VLNLDRRAHIKPTFSVCGPGVIPGNSRSGIPVVLVGCIKTISYDDLFILFNSS